MKKTRILKLYEGIRELFELIKYSKIKSLNT